MFAFADDVKLLGSNPKDLQNALSVVENWTKQWQLPIQSKKIEHIVFSKKRDHVSNTFYINGVTIQKLQSVKDLGIIINDDLKWTNNVNLIAMKASRVSNLLLRTFKSKNLLLYRSLFTTYIRPSLEYNTSIWGSCSTTNNRSVEKIQKHFTKCICKRLNIKFNSYEDRLNIFNLESLNYRRVKLDLILIYKILNRHIDLNPEDFFQISNFYDNHNLRRHNHCLKSLTIPKTTLRNNFFSYRILKTWNKLPGKITQSESLQQFKSRLKDIDLHDYAQLIY